MDCQKIEKIRRREIDTERGGESSHFLLSLNLMSNKNNRTTLQEHFLMHSHSAAHAERDYIKLPAAGGPRKYTLIDIYIYEKGEKTETG